MPRHVDGSSIAGGTVTEAVLAVEGIHCAACIQLIELRIGALPGIESVSASPVTHRVRVRWRAAAVNLTDITGAIARAGYRAWLVAAGVESPERRRAQRIALWRLFVAGFSMMQVMMYAFPAYLASDGEIPADIDTLLKIASFILTVPVLLFSAQPFLAGAWRDLRLQRIGMDVPVSIGILVTFAASVWATFISPGPVYYDSVSMFVFLLLGGRQLEAVARARAAGAVEELARLQPASAERLDAWPHSPHPPQLSAIAAEALRIGDHVLVRTGAAVPADGIVVEGASLNDEALLTGESVPVHKSPGSSVTGGAINLSAPLVVRVTAAGSDTQLSTIVRLIERAALAKPALTQLADRYAGVFLWGVLALAIIAASAWATVDPQRAVWVAVAVLIVTCPCALSLAAPVALSAAIGNLARHGVLVVQSHALETLARVTHFVFDKTGTLTTGRMQVQDVLPLGDLPLRGSGQHLDRDALLRLAARLEESAVHPIAQALAMAAAPLIKPGSVSAPLAEWREVAGSGIEAVCDGKRVRIGTLAFAQALHGKPLPADAAARISGNTVAALADEAGWLGIVTLGDGIRDGARELISALHSAGYSVTLLTGDNPSAATRVATALGISDVRAGASPDDKRQIVAALQRTGAVVAMTGDGVNDAPVLAQAHVAIAIGSGAPLAQTRADMVLMSARPADLAHAVVVAKRTVAVVRQNIAWAAGYNLIAIPLAAAGVITPWMAALGMTASSLIVVCNSLRLAQRKKKSMPASVPVAATVAVAAA